jgi:hypothetical protein
VVFDADMVPNANFFTKILEAMQVGRPLHSATWVLRGLQKYA